MAAVETQPRRQEAQDPGSRQLVLGCAAMVIALHLAVRAWALFPSWFYIDDFRLLDEATRSGLSLEYLIDPNDSQFMPVGRFLAWLVASQGLAEWSAAVTVTLVMQLLAALACLWMLVNLFGARWLVLVPLSVYLSTAITLPATMWWAASLNTLPLQIAFFVAVSAWVSYLRSGGSRWLVITLLALGFGLSAYVKAVVLFPVLAVLAFAWFSEGRLIHRVSTLGKKHWPALAAGTVLLAAFSAYYLTQVPQLTTGDQQPVFAELLESMLGVSLMVGVVGGPWQWSRTNPPAGLADPPDLAVHLAWVLVALAVAYWTLRRERSTRVFALFGLYSLMSYLLLLVTRAPAVGRVAGLEYRYLTDVACALALCLGLLLMPLRGARQAFATRREPPLRTAITSRAVVVLTTALVASGVASSVGYARIWHDDHPGASYLKNTRAALRDSGPVDFADTTVPGAVIPAYLYPYNHTPRLLPLVSENARFPGATSLLAVLDEQGTPRRALIEPVTTSVPGSTPDCGWEVGAGATTIPLRTTTFELPWWIRVGYLSSRSDFVTVQAGETTTTEPVRKGLQSLFVQVTGEIERVTLSGLTPGTTLCVDVIEVGNPVPGGPL